MCLAQSIAAELEVMVLTKQKNASLEQANAVLSQQVSEYGKQFDSVKSAIAKSNKVRVAISRGNS